LTPPLSTSYIISAMSDTFEAAAKREYAKKWLDHGTGPSSVLGELAATVLDLLDRLEEREHVLEERDAHVAFLERSDERWTKILDVGQKLLDASADVIEEQKNAIAQLKQQLAGQKETRGNDD
jgi:chromosome segregation ATPase